MRDEARWPALAVGLVVFLALLPAVAGAQDLRGSASIAEETGSTPPPEPGTDDRIVGGWEVDPPGKYPFMVGLVFRNNDNFNGQFCGGSLIGAEWVLTAAHCVYGKSASQFDVLVGAHNLTTDGYRIQVSSIIRHPDYNHNTLNNDIALLELTQAPPFSAVDLPADTASAAAGTQVNVIGWGKTQVVLPDGRTVPLWPEELREVIVSIASDASCNSVYGSDYRAATMFCGGGSGLDSCQGDSGGPAFAPTGGGRWTQAGIVSFGYGCAAPGIPGVYTRLSTFTDWITGVSGISPPNGSGGGGDTCRGEPATIVSDGRMEIVGTSGRDVIVGTGGADIIRGLGGDDVICGLGGKDRIYGGSGKDVVDGGPGNDKLFGQGGNDRAYGGSGKDVVDGGPGNDRLFGQGGNDTMKDGAGRDRSFGGAGNDRLVAGLGNDLLRGDGGTDTVDYRASSVAVEVDLRAGSATDRAFDDTLMGVENARGTARNDRLTGSAAANTLWGLGGDDTLVGLGGADSLFGGAGRDTVNGGPGVDTCVGEVTKRCEDGGGGGGGGSAVFTFGNGIHRVGTDVPPGRYRMISDGDWCYWARLSGFGGTLDEILANSFAHVTQIVDIEPSDAGFESDNCDQWSSDLAPRRPNPSAQWVSDGHLLVGSEISPGTWQNQGLAGGCYWERLTGFGGTLGEVIDNSFSDDPTIVTIAPGDAGFYADEDCGTWTKIG